LKRYQTDYTGAHSGFINFQHYQWLPKPDTAALQVAIARRCPDHSGLPDDGLRFTPEAGRGKSPRPAAFLGIQIMALAYSFHRLLRQEMCTQNQIAGRAGDQPALH
jgi:hypothetical protein